MSAKISTPRNRQKIRLAIRNIVKHLHHRWKVRRRIYSERNRGEKSEKAPCFSTLLAVERHFSSPRRECNYPRILLNDIIAKQGQSKGGRTDWSGRGVSNLRRDGISPRPVFFRVAINRTRKSSGRRRASNNAGIARGRGGSEAAMKSTLLGQTKLAGRRATEFHRRLKLRPGS